MSYQLPEEFFYCKIEENGKSKFPKFAFDDVIENKEHSTPLLLEILSEALDVDKIRSRSDDERDYMAPYFAYIILGEFKEKKAFPILIRMLRLSDTAIEYLIGDSLTEEMYRILGGTYDGDFEALYSLLWDEEVEVFSKAVVFNTLELLLNQGELGVERIFSLTGDLLESNRNSRNYMLNNFIVQFAARLEAMYSRGTLIEGIDHYFKNDLLERFFLYGKEKDASELIENTIRDLKEDGYKLTSDIDAKECCKELLIFKKPDKYEYKEPEVYPVRTTPKVGRNEQCPCGSEKKYKKCCLV